jgi:hypothetical protein
MTILKHFEVSKTKVSPARTSTLEFTIDKVTRVSELRNVCTLVGSMSVDVATLKFTLPHITRRKFNLPLSLWQVQDKLPLVSDGKKLVIDW